MDKLCLHLHLRILVVLWVEVVSLLVTLQGKVINGRFMFEVQPGMLMLLSESRDTVWFDSCLMETVKSTTLCLNSFTLQYVLMPRGSYHPLTGRQKWYRMADRDKAVTLLLVACTVLRYHANIQYTWTQITPKTLETHYICMGAHTGTLQTELTPLHAKLGGKYLTFIFILKYLHFPQYSLFFFLHKRPVSHVLNWSTLLKDHNNPPSGINKGNQIELNWSKLKKMGWWINHDVIPVKNGGSTQDI